MGNYRFIPSDRTTYAEELTAAYLDAQQSLGKNKCPRLMDIRISERVRAKQTETELHLAVELHPTHSSQPFHNHSMWLAAELLELIARFDLLRKARRRLLDAVAVQIDWIAFGERESADPYATAEAQLNVLAALDLLDSIDVNLTAAEQTLRVLKDERAESLDQLSLLYHRTCERLNSPKK